MIAEEKNIVINNDKSTWVKLHRDLLGNRIFHNEKLLKVFVWCILKASWKEYEQLVGRRTVKLMPGQFVTGRNKASAELDLPPTTTWTYLKILEDNESIDIKSDSKFSVITVVNWGLYQSQNEKLDSKTDSKRTANGHKQELKEFKEHIPLKKESKIFNIDDKEFKLAKYLSSQIAGRLDKPLKNESTLQSWSVEFNKMVRLDNYDMDEMKDVLIFSQNNEFWKKNILSAAKFRKQYLTLLAQMKG